MPGGRGGAARKVGALLQKCGAARLVTRGLGCTLAAGCFTAARMSWGEGGGTNFLLIRDIVQLRVLIRSMSSSPFLIMTYPVNAGLQATHVVTGVTRCPGRRVTPHSKERREALKGRGTDEVRVEASF